MTRGYSSTLQGQIHWRMTGTPGGPDLYCLHPAPFSGLAFGTILPHLASGRRVIAPDYPGHGGSDPDATPSIPLYAQAIAGVMAALSADAPVDLMGFHTGCLVAAAIAGLYPERVNRIVMIDAPFLDAADRDAMLTDAARPLELTPDLACLTGAWDRGMTRRIASQGLSRSFDMFVEQLRHGAQMNAAFGAARDFDCEAAFATVRHPVTVIATQSPLLDPTRAAAAAMPNAVLVERLDVTRAVLDEAAETISATVLKALLA